MEADGQLVAFLDAVASQTAAESGGTASGGAGPLSPAQLAEATAPVLFSPSAQVRQRSTLPALVLAAVTLAPEGLVARALRCEHVSVCHVKRPTCRCRLGVLTATSDGGLGVPLRESAIGRLRRAALVITQWLSSLQRQPQRQCQSGPAYPLLWRPSNVSSTIQLYAAGISAWSRRDEVK